MTQVHEGLEPRPQFDRPENVAPLRPVTGVDIAAYTVRCVDTTGSVIFETSNSVVVGREIIEPAPEFEGYIVVGEDVRSIIVTNDPARNIMVFFYQPEDFIEPDDTEGAEGPDKGDPYDPDDPYDPFGPGGPYAPPTDGPPTDSPPTDAPPTDYPPTDTPPPDPGDE